MAGTQLLHTKTTDELQHYYESGQYFKEIESTTQKAKHFIHTTHDHKQKSAAVFDIDETCLSNYFQLKRQQFPNTFEKLIHIFDLVKNFKPAQAILPTLSLYDYCLKKNIRPFFITGRPDAEQTQRLTAKNLLQMGFNHWEAIYYSPLDQNICKSFFHKKIVEQGYEIIINVGDQERDLVGSYAKEHFKLPNPFYRL